MKHRSVMVQLIPKPSHVRTENNLSTMPCPNDIECDDDKNDMKPHLNYNFIQRLVSIIHSFIIQYNLYCYINSRNVNLAAWSEFEIFHPLHVLLSTNFSWFHYHQAQIVNGSPELTISVSPRWVKTSLSANCSWVMLNIWEAFGKLSELKTSNWLSSLYSRIKKLPTIKSIWIEAIVDSS